MIPKNDLRKMARAWLRDAEVLFAARRYDRAVYVCGYAVELILKARICATLNWSGYPSSRGEFDGYQSFRTHDLQVLLRLSGREQGVERLYGAEWSMVSVWNPEIRYQMTGTASARYASDMIEAVRILLRVI